MNRIRLLLTREQRQESRLRQDPSPRLRAQIHPLKVSPEAPREPVKRGQVGIDERLGSREQGPHASVLVVDGIQEELGGFSQRRGGAGRKLRMELDVFADQV